MERLKRHRKYLALLIIVLIVGVAAAVTVDRVFAACSGPAPFPDVPAGHFACQYVTRLRDLGIVTGYNGNYDGNNVVTKYSMSIFIDRLSQADTVDTANVPYVFNLINDSAASEGDVIKAYSVNGEGLEGYSTGAAVADSGVYGQSNGTGSADAGVRGYAIGAGSGLYGQGVGADTTSYGVRGTSSNTHGVYGETFASSTAYFGGWFTGEKGVYGNAENTSGDGVYGYCPAGGACWAIRGVSANGYGVQGNTSRPDQMYGLHTSDKAYAGAGYNSVAGFSMVVQNGSAESLEVGDPVVVSGIGDVFKSSGTPLLLVGRAGAASSLAVIGVVETALRIDMVAKPDAVFTETTIPDPEGEEDDSQWLVSEETVEMVAIQSAVDGPAAPGDYLIIRVQGLALVKVDASAGAIATGAPLVVGGDGLARDAAAEGPGQSGMVIGQALEPLAAGQGLIWVLVSPR